MLHPQVSADDITLRWSHGELRISPTAAMLLDARLRTPTGWMSPFAAPHWDRDDPDVAGLAGHIRMLGGEFVCLPFGSAPLPADAAPGWLEAAGGDAIDAPSPPHGASADRDWQVVGRVPSRVVLALDLPEPDPVCRIERSISGIDGEAAIRFGLRIHARRAHRTSLGLHPIFRMPRSGETLTIDADFARGRTHPALVEGGSGLIPPDTAFSSLTDVGGIDVSTLPFAEEAEEVLQLLDVEPPVRLRWSNGDEVALDWPREHLPSVLLWCSDRRLTGAPWNGRYRGLGVEPIASAFDLPPTVSVAGNPLAQAGHATSLALDPRVPFAIEYRITAFGIMN
ncbi:hypothetical protein Q9R08_00925 [Microbacterium sp. QXD-8]|uniref:Aldose 1-epimerase n=1 Tax=Microbacterium psychrotolerans TaxID=3068321 RepID=A0ABU0YW23_9MICO|nr:hypothetical protein [Microbacterium sp. QXD-8]MDQ7876529.1 hypothetical protein [Microbacterium sp. QXD-8]